MILAYDTEAVVPNPKLAPQRSSHDLRQVIPNRTSDQQRPRRRCVLACTIQRLRLPTVEPRTAAARLRHALLDSYEEVKQACWISRSFSKKYVIHVMRITPATDSPRLATAKLTV